MGDLKTHGTASDWSMCDFSHQISWSSHQAEAFELQPYTSHVYLTKSEVLGLPVPVKLYLQA
jgi:hypothetical protein